MPPCSSGSPGPAACPAYWDLQPFLMFLPLLLILVFHGAWADLIGHIEYWWLSAVS